MATTTACRAIWQAVLWRRSWPAWPRGWKAPGHGTGKGKRTSAGAAGPRQLRCKVFKIKAENAVFAAARREVSPKAHRRKERQDLGENRTRLALALQPLGGRTGHLRSRAGPAGFKSATGLAGQGLGPRLRRAAAGEVGKDKGPDTSCSARGARHAERGPGDPRGTWAGLCRSNGEGAEPGAKVEVAWRSSEGRRLEITGQSPLAFWEIVAASWAEPQSRRPARFDHGGRQHLSSSEQGGLSP